MGKMKLSGIGIIVCMAVFVSPLHFADAELGPPIPKEKKIIAYTPDRMNTAYLHEHTAEIEQLPIDGLIISVYPDGWTGRKTAGRNSMWFGGAGFKKEEFNQAISDLKNTRFSRFTDNFIDFSTTVNKWGFTDTQGKPMPA